MGACTVLAQAEGYQINTFSAKQCGMGHVGVAMKLGTESQIFNPGALAFSGKTMDISASVTAIKSTVTADADGSRYTTSNKVGTPLNFSASFRVYSNLYAGVTFYTPYGSSIDWGKAWPGAVLNQSVDLQVYTVQPTISWRPIPNLSIGAGLMIGWGNINLNKGLISGADMNKLIDLMNMPYVMQGAEGPYKPYGEMPPASINLQGNSQPAIGVNVGALWDALPCLSIGASFRSKMNMHVTAGDASLSYANEQARLILGQQLDVMDNANFDASMPCPYIFTAGVCYKPIDNLSIAFDAQLNGWKTYRELQITFDGLDPELYSRPIPKQYKNAMTYHLGAEYGLTKRFDVRAGLMVDFSPCNDQHYNPETPGMTKYVPTVGFSFRPISGLSVDVAFMYVCSPGADGTGSSDNLLAPAYNGLIAQNGLSGLIEPMAAKSTFSAHYDAHAIVPSIGVSYKF